MAKVVKLPYPEKPLADEPIQTAYGIVTKDTLLEAVKRLGKIGVRMTSFRPMFRFERYASLLGVVAGLLHVAHELRALDLRQKQEIQELRQRVQELEAAP